MAFGDITRIDGWPVALGTAEDFYRLKAAFDAQGFRDDEGNLVTLHVYSGFRSYEDQEKIFRDRYRVGAHSPFGDYRRWLGVVWGRVSGEGTVAIPGSSNHGNGRALDIRDSGNNAGVTTAGNERSNWIRANAWNYGFNPAGFGFGEPWHIENTRVDQWSGNPVAPADSGNATPFNPNQEDDEMTEDEKKMLKAVHDVLLKDGKEPKDWSMAHKSTWLVNQFSTPTIDAPGGPSKKWTLPHILNWMARTLTSINDRVQVLEQKK